VSVPTLVSWCDKDRDDNVTIKEFRAGISCVSALRPQLSDKVSKAIFDSFDADGNGKLSFNELKQAIESANKRVSPKKVSAPRVASLLQEETPTDAAIDEAERGMHIALKRQCVGVATVMSWCDRDKSNGISPREFERMVTMCGLRPMPPPEVLTLVLTGGTFYKLVQW